MKTTKTAATTKPAVTKTAAATKSASTTAKAKPAVAKTAAATKSTATTKAKPSVAKTAATAKAKAKPAVVKPTATKSTATAKPATATNSTATAKAKPATATKATAKPTTTAKSKTKAKPATVTKSTAPTKTAAATKPTATAKPAAAKSSKTKKAPAKTLEPLKEKLKKLAANKPASSLDGNERKDVWVKQVDVLYKKVQNWLSEHYNSGHLKFNTVKVTLSEPSLGDYEVNSLELDLVGSHQVIFEPVEMNMLGAIGRMDFYHRGHNTHKSMLLLFKKGNSFQWELWKGLGKEEQVSFKQEALENMLSQWIES